MIDFNMISLSFSPYFPQNTMFPYFYKVVPSTFYFIRTSFLQLIIAVVHPFFPYDLLHENLNYLLLYKFIADRV